MKQSLMGKTFARWIVKGLLLLLLAVPGAGLAHAAHNGHGPKMAPGGGCMGCHQYPTMVVSGSGIPSLHVARSPELPPNPC